MDRRCNRRFVTAWQTNKLRLGDWRVVYTIESELILIQAVGHRREIYKNGWYYSIKLSLSFLKHMLSNLSSPIPTPDNLKHI